MVDEKNQSDIVNEAFAALRPTPPDQGPSLQALERTLQAVHQAQEKTNVISLVERIGRMNKFIKYPIAAGLALALILGAGYALLGGHAAVAFADVKAQFQQAKTMQMTMSSEMQMAGKTITIRMKWMMKEPGLIRVETEGPGSSVAINAARQAASGRNACRRARSVWRGDAIRERRRNHRRDDRDRPQAAFAGG